MSPPLRYWFMGQTSSPLSASNLATSYNCGEISINDEMWPKFNAACHTLWHASMRTGRPDWLNSAAHSVTLVLEPQLSVACTPRCISSQETPAHVDVCDVHASVKQLVLLQTYFDSVETHVSKPSHIFRVAVGILRAFLHANAVVEVCSKSQRRV